MHETTIQNGIAIIQLDDGKANAVGHALIDAVNAGLDQAQSDADAVLIAGRPGLFSAGFDLKEFENGPAATHALVNKGAQLLLRCFSHPQPVVAACPGHAIAAGALLLLAVDNRLGAEGDFRLGLNETAIGMSLPEFGLQLAAARLSKRHHTQAVVQSELFDPQSAVDAGFLDQVCPPESLLEQATTLAEKLAKLPSEAYAKNKRDSRRQYIDAIAASLS